MYLFLQFCLQLLDFLRFWQFSTILMNLHWAALACRSSQSRICWPSWRRSDCGAQKTWRDKVVRIYSTNLEGESMNKLLQSMINPQKVVNFTRNGNLTKQIRIWWENSPVELLVGVCFDWWLWTSLWLAQTCSPGLLHQLSILYFQEHHFL